MATELEPVDEGQRELDIRLGLGMFARAQQLEHLISISRQVDLDPGQVLYTRGDPPHHLIQLMSGEVELQSPSSPPSTITSGIVGWIDFILARPHAHTAIATSTARILELDAADYLDYLEDNFDVTHRLLARTSSELAAQITSRSDAATAFTLAPSGPLSRRFANVEIPVIERIMLLGRMAVFANVSTQALATLGQRAVEVRFDAGESIAPVGERASVFSILVEGVVELALPGGPVARRTGPALLAHVEELSDSPRLTAATAATPVIALQVDREELLDQVEEHFDLARALFRFLAASQETVNDAAGGAPLALGWQ